MCHKKILKSLNIPLSIRIFGRGTQRHTSRFHIEGALKKLNFNFLQILIAVPLGTHFPKGIEQESFQGEIE